MTPGRHALLLIFLALLLPGRSEARPTSLDPTRWLVTLRASQGAPPERAVLRLRLAEGGDVDEVDAQLVLDLPDDNASPGVRSLRDALALTLAGSASQVLPRASGLRHEGAAEASIRRDRLTVLGQEASALARHIEALLAPGSEALAGWRVVELRSNLSAPDPRHDRRPQRWRGDREPAPTSPRWVATAVLALAFLLGLGLLLGSGLAELRASRRSTGLTLAGILALGLLLRLLVPATLMRGNLNSYTQLVVDAAVTESVAAPPLIVPAGRSMLLLPLAALGGLDLHGIVAFDIAVGVLSAFAAFIALRRLGRQDISALVGAGIMAISPACVRFSASEDPMILVTLLGWMVVAGVALAADGRRRGWWILASAAAFAPWVKAEALLSVGGLAVLMLALAPRRLGRPGWQAFAAGTWAAGGLGLYAWLLLSSAETSSPTYHVFGLERALANLSALPAAFSHANALTDPRYAPVSVTILAALGILLATRSVVARVARALLARTGNGTGSAGTSPEAPGPIRASDAVAWTLVLLALWLKVYGSYPPPFSELAAATKDHVRLSLHAAVPLACLAAFAFAWLWRRCEERWCPGRVLMIAALPLGLLPTALPAPGYWGALWSEQREASFLKSAEESLPPALPAHHRQRPARAWRTGPTRPGHEPARARRLAGRPARRRRSRARCLAAGHEGLRPLLPRPGLPSARATAGTRAQATTVKLRRLRGHGGAAARPRRARGFRALRLPTRRRKASPLRLLSPHRAAPIAPCSPTRNLPRRRSGSTWRRVI